MRWKVTPIGAKRVRRAFLLFPKRIGTEWRWLETAYWEEEFANMGLFSDPWVSWCPVRWVTADDAVKEQP